MKKFIHFFISGYFILVMTSCNEQGQGSACQQIRSFASNREMGDRMCHGDLTGGINGSLTPPQRPTCPGCEDREETRGSRYDETPPAIYSVANLNCLSPRGNPEHLQAMQVGLENARRGERSAANRLVTTIVELAGEDQAHRLIGGGALNFRFFNHLERRSNNTCLPGTQTSGSIDIARRCSPNSTTPSLSYDDNDKLGLMAHEAGHVVGNRGFYSGYFNNVPRCDMTRYCSHNTVIDRNGRVSYVPNSTRNEEFAEVFAAFLYQTDRLRERCPQAYEYMRDQVFKVRNGQDRYCH